MCGSQSANEATKAISVRYVRHMAKLVYKMWLTKGVMLSTLSASKSHAGCYIYRNHGYQVLIKSNGAIWRTTKEN